MQVIIKDLLSIEKGILCHQTNCKGVMGAGVARQIAIKWPSVERAYIKYCNTARHPLGTVQIVEITSDLFVANIFGQNFYGTKFGPPTNYEAVETAFRNLSKTISAAKHNTFSLDIFGLDIYIPYKMGCGLGGGNWDKYLEIITSIFPDVIVCKREGDT